MKSDWKNESHVVLDACALIAFLNDEPGANVVATILKEVPSVEMSAVNLLEIAYDTIRTSGDSNAGRKMLDEVR
jgi:PIN domain nuclease of toxin-antitoxin system